MRLAPESALSGIPEVPSSRADAVPPPFAPLLRMEEEEKVEPPSPFSLLSPLPVCQEEEEEEAEPLSAPVVFSPPLQAPLPTRAPVAVHPCVLPPAVAELFDKMVGVLTVAHLSDVTHTTLTLNADTHSPFAGTRITLQEYRTAPKTFNVELAASPEAVAMLHQHLSQLTAALHACDHPFQIHRIDTALLPASETPPLFRRKERASSEDQSEGEEP